MSTMPFDVHELYRRRIIEAKDDVRLAKIDYRAKPDLESKNNLKFAVEYLAALEQEERELP